MILLSSATPLAGGTLKFGGKLLLGKLDGKAKKAGMEDKYNSWNINAAYEYPLSKRTYVYGFAGYADGRKVAFRNCFFESKRFTFPRQYG